MEQNQQNQPNQNNKKPLYKRWWFWVILIIVVIIVVPNVCNKVTNNSSSSTSNSGSNNQTSYGMNQTVTVRELEFTILSVYDTKQIGGEYINETTEYNFVVVQIRIKNNSNEEKYISDSNFYYYRGNNKYESSNAGIYLDENGFWLNETIGAGLSKTINVVFEIPSEHLETDYILAKDSYKTEKIYLKETNNE